MKNSEIKAALKGFFYGLFFIVLFLLTKLSLNFGEKGLDQGIGPYWIMSVAIISVVLVILGIFVSVKFVPPLAEKIANTVVMGISEPYEPSTPLEKARSLVLQKRFEEAADKYQEAIDLEWITHKTWFEISDLFREKLREPQKAIELLTRAMDEHNWRMDEHIGILQEIAEIQFYDLNSKAAAEGIYEFIDNKYGSTPFGKTFLEKSFFKFKPEKLIS